MNLIKSKERSKDLGEVFTPNNLIDQMLNSLPDEVWEPKKTFLEPSCGNGNFIVEIVKRKIKNGSNPLDALSTTYGVDIMTDNIKECQLRLLKLMVNILDKKEFVEAFKIILSNIRVGNTLSEPLNEIFKTPSDINSIISRPNKYFNSNN